MNIGHVETDCSVCGRNLSMDDVPVPTAELMLDRFHDQHRHTEQEMTLYYHEERARAWGEDE